MNPSPNFPVRDLLIDGSTLYVGGDFSTLAATGRQKAGAFSLNTHALLPWNPGVNGPVYSMASANGLIYCGGHFSAVNITLGLPFPRTSPDHGTALDIAGRGIADASSLIEAIRVASRIASRDALHR